MREDWIECEADLLGDLIRGINYKKPQSSDSEKEGYLPILRANNINSNTLNFENLKYVEKELIKSEQNILKGDIVFAMSSGSKHLVGKSGQAQLDYQGSFGAFCSVFRPNENINPNFIQFYFHSGAFRRIISNASKGSNINNLKREHVLNAIIPLPPNSEQRTIVAKIEELFSDLDKGIADLKKAQDQLVIFRQAVLKKAFAGELTKEWREQQTDLPTAEELLEQIKEERQNYFKLKLEAWKQAIKIWEENGKKGKNPGKPKEPKYFEDLTPVELKDFNVSGGFYTKMGNLSDIVRGGSPRPAGDERFYNGPIPFLKVADLTRKKGVYVDTYTYSIKEAGLQKTRMLDIGTLVISNSGATLGVPKITAIKATANDGIAAFLGLTESRSIFLYHYWNSKTLALRAIDQGAGQPNLNTDLLKAYPVPVFSDEEQHQILKEIESRLSVCDKVEQSITESLEKAKALRQSILKKAFEGTLLSAEEIAKCKAAKDYEPASVLLKKIKAETLRQAQGKKKKK